MIILRGYQVLVIRLYIGGTGIVSITVKNYLAGYGTVTVTGKIYLTGSSYGYRTGSYLTGSQTLVATGNIRVPTLGIFRQSFRVSKINPISLSCY
jgi:hypothetical protein